MSNDLEHAMRYATEAGILAALMLAAASAGHAAEPRPPHKLVGKASVYSSRFQGRHMADGERFSTRSNAAASKALPLGTKARVTDLQTGKSAVVTIKDRGPVPKGRVVDLTPATAKQIGLTPKQGVAPVAIVPTQLPAKAETANNGLR
ncbi:septal ring lytic transglycosylase RlpA family protein [Lichenicoccus sp.]|uniref:septal ring lytic transglycosylase RlpA family protein n=1 Tax=Lichenicoccus sp. TaxID=2781899 RepID=UPI003D0A1CBA